MPQGQVLRHIFFISSRGLHTSGARNRTGRLDNTFEICYFNVRKHQETVQGVSDNEVIRGIFFLFLYKAGAIYPHWFCCAKKIGIFPDPAS